MFHMIDDYQYSYYQDFISFIPHTSHAYAPIPIGIFFEYCATYNIVRHHLHVWTKQEDVMCTSQEGCMIRSIVAPSLPGFV